jgi:hypothetical protein
MPELLEARGGQIAGSNSRSGSELKESGAKRENGGWIGVPGYDHHQNAFWQVASSRKSSQSVPPFENDQRS